LSRFVSAWPCPVKPFSSEKKGRNWVETMGTGREKGAIQKRMGGDEEHSMKDGEFKEASLGSKEEHHEGCELCKRVGRSDDMNQGRGEVLQGTRGKVMKQSGTRGSTTSL
jgi:hypothetical protein